MLLRSRLLVSSARGFSTSSYRNIDFTHCVIGGGAVGLATAVQLSKRPGTNTILLEQHGEVGMETSSRNSEVIHAGIYYPRDSLKTKLCIKGKLELYKLCEKYGISYQRTGKWIIAQNGEELQILQKIYEHAKSLNVPVRWVSKEEAKTREPDVRAEAGILESPTTGILDSHAYMTHLAGRLNNYGGDIAFHSTVTKIAPISSSSPSSLPEQESGYSLTIASPSSPSSSSSPQAPPTTTTTTTTITASKVINSAGLSACSISNLLLPPHRHVKPYFAKGTYYTYASSGPKPKILIYPVPEPGLAGLGTHLTIDLAGRVRFGPDVEWVSDPRDLSPGDGSGKGVEKKVRAAVKAVRRYLPDVEGADGLELVPDYCGIRPKLVGPSKSEGGGVFRDFVVREEEGFKGFVNLLGIESPGLTSSLAIAEMVEKLLYGTISK